MPYESEETSNEQQNGKSLIEQLAHSRQENPVKIMASEQEKSEEKALHPSQAENAFLHENPDFEKCDCGRPFVAAKGINDLPMMFCENCNNVMPGRVQ